MVTIRWRKIWIAVFAVLALFVLKVYAQDPNPNDPVIPEFPVVLSTVLGALSAFIVQGVKKILPSNGLVRLGAAAFLSVLVGVIAALIVGIDITTQQGAFFVSVVFAYSQVGWAAFKNIRELGNV